MVTHEEKQQVIRNANDAQAHARMVLAKCIAGLAVVVLAALAGVVLDPPGGDVRAATRAQSGHGRAVELSPSDVPRTAYSPEERAAEPHLTGVR